MGTRARLKVTAKLTVRDPAGRTARANVRLTLRRA
jgi:hypothetical protein